jgi:hypothetical protein
MWGPYPTSKVILIYLINAVKSSELIQAGSETLQSEIHKPINSVWNKEELPDQWKESIIAPIYKKGDKND